LALVLLALPCAAQAATVRVDFYTEPAGVDPESSCSRYMMCPPDRLVFTAADGEANDVSITRDGSRFIVRDAGATVEPGPGCERVDANAATCFAPVVGGVALGDRDDRITSLVGGAGGGDGNDVLVVGSGDGGAGDDIVTCIDGVSSCVLSGGAGSDRVTGGARDDTISGGPGGSADNDALDGGEGVDLVSYAGHTAPVEVELAGAQRFASPGESDSIARFERVDGGSGDDVLGGAEGVTIPSFVHGMAGGPGNDRITVRSPMGAFGEEGDDLLTGGAARDLLDGGRGDDDLRGGLGNDRLTGGSGADILRGQAGDDSLGGGDGRRGNDRLACGTGRRDRATADRRDRVTGCERLRRRR
jgi:Ca2+-binding RTX toxin-like protein